MKKIIIISGLIIFSLYASYAIDKPKQVPTKISGITVYLQGAQINRSGHVSIPAGNSTIIFTDLPQSLNPQSIQVSGKGTFDILSVSHQINYLRSQEKTKETKILEDSLEYLQQEIDKQNAMLSVYSNEESLLLENKKIGGANTGVSITSLKEAADYYRSRLTDIQNKKLSIKKDIIRLQEQVSRISNQIAGIQTKRNIPTSEIIVSVNAKAATTADFSLSYLVNNAGWVPFYDLRVNDVNKPVEIVYKANVYQTTGEDWENVKLVISTSNPMLNSSKPTMYPWYLRFSNPTYYDKNKKYASVPPRALEMAKEEVVTDDEYANRPKAGSSADYTVVTESTTSIEFTISLPYDISSNGKPNAVEIQKSTLPATYEYFVAPKIDNDAFLLARVTGWENLNLLSGETNLYFSGTYVGKSYINAQATNDTLELSLGRDKNISVTRTRLTEFNSRKLIGLNQKVTRGWEISVRNKKSQAVTMTIQDQVPISTDKEIEIERTETSGATFTETTGLLTWKVNLKPAESKKLKFIYSVKYPKDKNLIIE